MLSLAFLLVFRLAPDLPEVKYSQPQMASLGDRVGLTFGSADTIYYATSKNDGETFTQPVALPTGGKMALGRHRGPRMVYHTNGLVISAIVGKKGGGADGDLMAWRSENQGETWAKPVRINDVPGSAREGLHAMTSGNGWILAAWLDLRDKGTRLYMARSTDGGRSWSRNFLVYESPEGTICQCCHPSLVVAAGGAVHAMFRNSLDGSRDMYIATSRDGGSTWKIAEKLGRGTWKLNACPMDGGSLTVSANNKIYTVWRREKTIYVSLPDTKESELGEGKDPAVASGFNDHIYAVWVSPTGAIMTRSTEVDQAKELAPKGGYPQILFTGHRVLAAWEDENGIAVGTVPSPSLKSASDFQ